MYEALKERPILSLSQISKRTAISFSAASPAMQVLVEQGIAREITGKPRGRLFAYDRYLAIMSEGTDAL